MKKILLSLILLVTAAGMAFAQSDIQVLTVVKYNKPESITVKQLKSRCETYQKQMGKKLTVEEKKLVLKSLTEEKLILQAAQKVGITVPDSQVDQYFIQGMSQQIGANVSEKELNELLKKQQGITLDELLLQQVGMNVADYKLYLKNQLIAQQYILQQKQSELMKVAPTDEEIRTFYESNKASFVWNDMIKLFMIIVPKGTDPSAALVKVTDLRNKYVENKLTTDQISIQSRMDGANFQAGELLLPKTEAGAASVGMNYAGLISLFANDKGYTTDVKETDIDYRVVIVCDKYNAKMLSISDVVQPETTVTVYEYIRSNLQQQKQMIYIQQAAQEIADGLNKPEYVEEKKTGAALDKLLEWETN